MGTGKALLARLAGLPVALEAMAGKNGEQDTHLRAKSPKQTKQFIATQKKTSRVIGYI
jgi:hypothetical protein